MDESSVLSYLKWVPRPADRKLPRGVPRAGDYRLARNHPQLSAIVRQSKSRRLCITQLAAAAASTRTRPDRDSPGPEPSETCSNRYYMPQATGPEIRAKSEGPEPVSGPGHN